MTATALLNRVQRWFPFFSYHHLLMLVNICAILFWSFLLAACTSSNGLTNVYLFSLSYKAPTTDASADPFLLNYGVVDSLSDQLSRSNNTLQEIRVGYLGMCLALQSGVWICGGSPDAMITELKALDIQDPLNIFRLAQHVRSEILFYPLIIIAIVFSLICTMLLGTFPGWRTEDDGEGSEREVKPFPSRPVSQLALGFIGISSLLGLASAFWQHIGSSGATTLTRLLTYDMVEARVGATGMVFGWLGASCAGITTIGLFIMILSIRVLEQLSN